MFFDCTGLMAGLVATVITKVETFDIATEFAQEPAPRENHPVYAFLKHVFCTVESESQLQLWVCEGRNTGRLHQWALPPLHIILHLLRGEYQ